jgi:hypothetical protein
MPSARLAAAAFAALLSVLAVRPAAAQNTDPQPTPYAYGTIGYADHLISTAAVGTVQLRIGARINPWFGVEGEFGWGINRNGLHRGESVRINDQEALYGVAYLPLTPAFSLFGRLGGQRTQFNFAGPAPGHTPDGSYNVGAGGVWYLDPHNGVRAEYTLEAFDNAPNADTWAISYVRRF